MATLAQLVARTAERMSQVAGTGVQTYAEDRLAEMIQHKFDIVFDDHWWPSYNNWSTWVLDGTNGIVTTDLTDIVKRFEDVRKIYVAGTEREIIMLSPENNPLTLEGTTPLYYEATSDTTRVFKIWPLASTGSIDVNYRTKPDTFTAEDEVVMDDQLLILGAAWDYLEDDGTNPNASQKFQSLFEDRMDQLTKLQSKRPIPLDAHARRPETITITTL